MNFDDYHDDDYDDDVLSASPTVRLFQLVDQSERSSRGNASEGRSIALETGAAMLGRVFIIELRG